MRCSFRIPPTKSSKEVAEFTKKELERDPPYGAKVEVDTSIYGFGWYGTNALESFN